jgi:hypothetical protein
MSRRTGSYSELLDARSFNQIWLNKIEKPEKALTDFHKSRRDSDEFSDFEVFREASDKLAKDLGGPTYTEWLKQEQD